MLFLSTSSTCSKSKRHGKIRMSVSMAYGNNSTRKSARGLSCDRTTAGRLSVEAGYRNEYRIKFVSNSAIAQSGRAGALGASGRWFESGLRYQFIPHSSIGRSPRLIIVRLMVRSHLRGPISNSGGEYWVCHHLDTLRPGQSGIMLPDTIVDAAHLAGRSHTRERTRDPISAYGQAWVAGYALTPASQVGQHAR